MPQQRISSHHTLSNDAAIHFVAEAQSDEGFETLFKSHVHTAPAIAPIRVQSAPSTTTRLFIEGLPDESEDYAIIEGSSVTVDDRIGLNLLRSLVG